MWKHNDYFCILCVVLLLLPLQKREVTNIFHVTTVMPLVCEKARKFVNYSRSNQSTRRGVLTGPCCGSRDKRNWDTFKRKALTPFGRRHRTHIWLIRVSNSNPDSTVASQRLSPPHLQNGCCWSSVIRLSVPTVYLTPVWRRRTMPSVANDRNQLML